MIPQYRQWKTRDQGYAVHQGKRQYFPGKYDSPESISAYIAWLRRLTIQPSYTLSQASLAYLEHLKASRGTSRKGPYGKALYATRALTEAVGDIPLEELAPKHLRMMQEHLSASGASRSTITQRLAVVKRMARWLALEDYCDDTVATRLQLAPNIGMGAPVVHRHAVAWRDVQQVMKYAHEPIRSMIHLQWLTGVRSGSLVEAHVSQFPDWRTWLPKHKTDYLGQTLEIPLGRSASKIVEKASGSSPNGFLFPTRLRGRYSSDGFRQAIRRIQEQHGLKLWSPHQIRHAVAQRVRERYGAEAAQAVLGHASLKTTEMYSRRLVELARMVAEAEG